MKYDQKKAEQTLSGMLTSFPHLKDSLRQINGEALLIGATILHFYKVQDWIDHARSTGDIDLSIGTTPGIDEYSLIKSSLLQNGYIENPEMKYRLERAHPSVRSSVKIDLLVHPKSTVDEVAARQLMGVGEEWSFEGIRYGLTASLPIADNIYLPNPIGFLGLKAYSFHGDPRRVRDLVDICDVIKGLVSKSMHYDLSTTFSKMGAHNTLGHKFTHSMLRGLADPENMEWDLSRARQEFLMRGYTELEIDGTMNDIVREFLDAIE
jgi:hypothetical protein